MDRLISGWPDSGRHLGGTGRDSCIERRSSNHGGVIGRILVFAVLATLSLPANARYVGPTVAGRLEAPPKLETSGLAASRQTAGLLWTHDDSGGEAALYGVQFDGKKAEALRLRGTKNIDWEDVAAFERDGKAWLLVGDVPPQPHGEVVIRTIAMPADANANGDIFGGWLMSQMDLGGAILARGTAQCRVTIVAVDGMSFLRPVNVGDVVTCYAQLLNIGRTSIKIAVEAWVQRYADTTLLHVTEGTFTYVAIDDSGKPHAVKRRSPFLH